MTSLGRSVWFAVGALGLAALGPGLARADESSERAETLFATAQACLERDDWICACDNFAASMAAEPSVSTQLNIAKCQMHAGKPSEAWRTTQAAMKLNAEVGYEDETRRRALADYGAKLAREYEAATAELVLSLANRPPGLEVSLDGIPIAPPELGAPIRLDPGKHEILARAQGHALTRTFVFAAAGGRLEVPIALEPQVEPAPPPPEVLRPPGPTEQPAPSNGVPAQTIAGWTVGALGVAALGTSLALGIVTVLRSDSAEDSTACQLPVDNNAIQTWNGLRDDARGFQTSAIAVAVPGAVLLGAGIVLLVTAPSSPEPALNVVLSTRGLGLSLEGRF